MQKAGWIEGKNIGVDYRFGGGDPAKINASAAELVALAPELIYVTGDPPAVGFFSRSVGATQIGTRSARRTH